MSFIVYSALSQDLADKKDVLYIPGGATQNSVRVAQWILKTPGSTSYYGCIGKDDFGEKMQAYCKRDGVDVSVSKIFCFCELSSCRSY
jgi:adenosine kinase